MGGQGSGAGAPWTEEEEAHLRTWYPRIGAKGASRTLLDHLGSVRTPFAVSARAHLMGLFTGRRPIADPDYHPTPERIQELRTINAASKVKVKRA